MTAPRILFPFAGDAIGGSHFSALALMDGLDRRQFTPVIALHEHGRLADHLTARGTAFLAAPAVPYAWHGRLLRNVLTMRRCARALAPFLRTHRIAAVHTNNTRMHLTWALAARRAGVRLVWHQRTSTPMGPSGILTGLADEILAVSSFTTRAFAGRARRRTRVIPNPIYAGRPPTDRSAARAMVLDRIAAAADTHLVAFAANLERRKRPLVFVDAAARLRDRYGDGVRCLMFGAAAPPLDGAVRARIAALGLETVCRPMGFLIPIEPWLAGCDLLMAPGVNEPLGRAIIEAMLAGTPVVAAAAGGNPEILEAGVTGLLVPPDAPAAFAEAAAGLLDDRPRAAALAGAAQASARRRYRVDDHVAAVSAIYRALLGA